jgi:hypothetical protein
MTTISSEQFEKICSEVWRDRADVLRGRDLLSGEAALVRAVYWRLCKAGVKPSSSGEHYGSLQTTLAYKLGVGRLLKLSARPQFDEAPFLNDLVDRYKTEVAHDG